MQQKWVELKKWKWYLVFVVFREFDEEKSKKEIALRIV